MSSCFNIMMSFAFLTPWCRLTVGKIWHTNVTKEVLFLYFDIVWCLNMFTRLFKEVSLPGHLIISS